MIITIPYKWCKGLGTQICTISAIADSQYDTVKFLENTAEYKNFKFFVDYYNLDLNIILGQPEIIDNKIWFDDFTKLCSPYIKKDIKYKDNKYICLSMYQDLPQYLVDDTANNYPFNKIYTLDQYSEIFKLSRKFGYDIVTMDSMHTTIQEKLDLLSKCRAVIGYEGGILHLAHTLGIPCIMLPWRNKSITPTNLTELLHLDLKTYFLRDINELLSMNKTEFHRILHLLDVNKGNNSVVHTKFRKKMLRGLNISKQELQLLPEHKQFGGF